MTPQELKNSILQLAIQGRLVEQRPEEGTAEELYKRIQAEKQSLIKAGKIKKEKPFSLNVQYRDYPRLNYNPIRRCRGLFRDPFCGSCRS